MASNNNSLPLFFILFTSLLLLTLIPSKSQANTLSPHSHNETSSPFGFLNQLRGCHKGDKVKGLNELRKYLQHFGYLAYSKDSSHVGDDEFDDLLEKAIRTYQKNYNLNVTGSLDSKTVTQMSQPRCGVPDIINGTTRMNSDKKKHHHRHSFFRTVSHYTFFQGSPKWPFPKYHLTYKFLSGTPSEAMNPVSRAFDTWAANTHFSFSWVDPNLDADIKISFGRGDHGDNSPFDGPGGVLAHAYAPTDGRFHYDADEVWSVGPVPGAFDLETVALHEIGHLLGLDHSSVEGAIMWSSIIQGSSKGLHADDIAGIKALYNT